MYKTGERNSWIINKTETEERWRENQNWNTYERERERERQLDQRDRHTDRRRQRQEEGLEAADHPPRMRMSVSRRAVSARTPSSSTTGIQLLSQVKI